MDQYYDKALVLFKEEKFEKSKKICQQILEKNPRDLNTLILIAVIAYKRKNYLKSLEIFDFAIKFYPNVSELYLNKTLVLIDFKKYSKALISCEKLILLDKLNPKVHNLKGIIFLKQKRIKEAINILEKSLDLDKKNYETLNNLGIAFKEIKNYEKSINFLNKSINLNPNNSQAYINLANVYEETRNLNEAIINLNKAIKLNPESSEAYNNRGSINKNLNNFNEAINDYNLSLKLNPTADVYNNIGNLYKKENDLDKALFNYEKVVNFDKDFEAALGNVIHSRNKLCIWDDYENTCKYLKKKIIENKLVTKTLPLLSIFDSNDIIYKSARLESGDDQNLKKKKITIFNNKKIKLGYYSADFRNHAVSYQLNKLIELHSREKFEIFAFSFFNKKDEMQQNLSKIFDHFIDVETMSDEDIAKLSKKNKIDIAIDLMGFTQNNRFNIFKIGCAPIQINFLGYAGTTGSKFIDYIIADKIVIPKEKQKNYSEKIIYLPHCFMINDDSKNGFLDQVKKGNYNLPKNKFVFANFNKFYKITPNIFNTWMQLLAKIPNSILWLANDNNTGRKNIVKKAIESGLHEDRIFFADKMPKYADYIERLKNIDLYLDTYPYSSHVIGCDVVKADVPIVTLSGETFASNVCASILNDLKLSELVTKNIDEYKNKIIEICKSEEILKKIKTKLKENKKNSVLFNSKIYVQNFENSLEQVYMNFIKNKIPENIFIDN